MRKLTMMMSVTLCAAMLTVGANAASASNCPNTKSYTWNTATNAQRQTYNDKINSVLSQFLNSNQISSKNGKTYTFNNNCPFNNGSSNNGSSGKGSSNNGSSNNGSSNNGSSNNGSSNNGSSNNGSSNNGSSNNGSSNNGSSSSVSAYESEVVRLVNVERAKNGLGALTLNAKLSDVARAKSQDMRDKGYFSHTSPTYGSPFDMMTSFGISYRTAGENIAMGYSSPQAVVTGWMNSPGHRANILNSSFTQIGVGYVASGNYWTQMFIG